MLLVPTITADDAATMLAAACAAARDAEAHVTIAVVDSSGALLALTRMPGARAHTVDLATRKARTSAALGLPTAMLEAVYTGKPAPAELMILPGGVPVISATHSAGAIGVSGASGQLDDTIARAGAAAIPG